MLAKLNAESLTDKPDQNPETVLQTSAAPAPKYVLFVLDETHYAVPLENVLELQRLPRITPLPHVPEWLSGVTNLRGEVLSVVDLRELLGLPAAESSTSQRLIVVRSTREEIAVGWIVDRIVGIRGLAAEDLKPCSSLMTGPAVSFLSGIVERDERLIAVLDVNRVLASPEMRQFEPQWQEEIPVARLTPITAM
jgi:purine-binding chemotaxis protein CheW